MEWIGWAIGLVGVLVTIVTSYLFRKKSEGARGEKIKSVRKEVVGMLINEFSNSDKPLQASTIQSLMNSKYRELNIPYVTDSELPFIVDDMIAYFVGNVFITSEKRQVLVDKALALKKSFEKRVSHLEEASGDWEKSSVTRIVFGLFSMFMLGLGSGFLIVILLFYLDLYLFHRVLDSMSLYTQLGLVFVTSIVIVYLQYYRLGKIREKSSRHLHRVLENTTIESLTNTFPNVTVERNVIVGSEGNFHQLDLVLTSDGIRLPVEIKHTAIKVENIKQIANIMRQMKSPKALLVTSTRVGAKTRKLAEQNGVILLEGINSEVELLNRLKNTKL